MLNAVPTKINGKNITFIMFPINVIKYNNTGCITLADTILPVVTNNVISIGIKLDENATRS